MKQTNWMNFVALVTGILCLGLILDTDAYAQEMNPCSEDIAKFCKDVKGDIRSLLGCLEEHEDELSDACRNYEAKMEGMRSERKEIVRQQRAIFLTCKDDVGKFCKDVDPKDGGILKCLNEHERELSTLCNESIKTARGEENKKP